MQIFNQISPKRSDLVDDSSRPYSILEKRRFFFFSRIFIHKKATRILSIALPYLTRKLLFKQTFKYILQFINISTTLYSSALKFISHSCKMTQHCLGSEEVLVWGKLKGGGKYGQNILYKTLKSIL